MYTLIIDTQVMKFLEKLPLSLSQRIFKKLQETKTDPHRFFIGLVGRKEFKLRVGVYRIIADIQDDKLLILVIGVGHRKNIYKKI